MISIKKSTVIKLLSYFYYEDSMTKLREEMGLRKVSADLLDLDDWRVFSLDYFIVRT